MKFLIDAQLPKKLALFLESKGFDTKHTLDLCNGNKTKDTVINQITLDEKRVLVSKDLDFVESLLVSNKPYKLIGIAMGNISNKKLLQMFDTNIMYIVEVLKDARYIEITNEKIIVKF